jgi:hypothetical protein
MNDILLREWGNLDYHDPESVLRELRKIQLKFADKEIDEKVRNLRTNLLKRPREGRAAALFCMGISKYMGEEVIFSLTESSDYDFVVCWKKDDLLNYASVQLKELVPEQLNPNAEINDLLAKLEKYSDSNSLIVAIYLNRDFHLDCSLLDLEGLSLAGLYTFGAISKDQNKWVLHGNYLRDFQETRFEYPYSDDEDV